MREYPDWIKTTLKEDREISRAMMDALVSNPDIDQLAALAAVKFHYLDKNRDLMSKPYYRFLQVLDQLGVDPPKMNVYKRDPESGTWYEIPRAGQTRGGKSKAERLEKRAAWRLKVWNVELARHDLNKTNVDILLAQPDTQIGALRDDLLGEMQEMESRLMMRINAIEHDLHNIKSMWPKTSLSNNELDQLTKT